MFNNNQQQQQRYSYNSFTPTAPSGAQQQQQQQQSQAYYDGTEQQSLLQPSVPVTTTQTTTSAHLPPHTGAFYPSIIYATQSTFTPAAYAPPFQPTAALLSTSIKPTPFFTRQQWSCMALVTVLGLAAMFMLTLFTTSLVLRTLHAIRGDSLPPPLYFAVVPRAANAITTARMVNAMCKKHAIQNNGQCHFIVYSGATNKCGSDDMWKSEFQRQYHNITSESMSYTRMFSLQGEFDNLPEYRYTGTPATTPPTAVPASKWVQPEKYFALVESHNVEPLEVQGKTTVQMLFMDSKSLIEQQQMPVAKEQIQYFAKEIEQSSHTGNKGHYDMRMLLMYHEETTTMYRNDTAFLHGIYENMQLIVYGNSNITFTEQVNTNQHKNKSNNGGNNDDHGDGNKKVVIMHMRGNTCPQDPNIEFVFAKLDSHNHILETLDFNEPDNHGEPTMKRWKLH